jgi:aminomethyltransferase
MMNAVGMDVEITEVTDDVAALSFQGPNTRKVLNIVAEKPVDELKYFRMMKNKISGVEVTISRTGYTGDLGYEIWMDAKDALPIWDKLMEVGGDYGMHPSAFWQWTWRAWKQVSSCSMWITPPQLTHGSSRRNPLPTSWDLIGQSRSISLATSSVAAHWNVRSAKAPRGRWSAWKWIGLAWKSYSQASACRRKSLAWLCAEVCRFVMVGNVQVGYASTSTWSPVLKKYIALAHLQKPYFEVGTDVRMEITVEHHRQHAPAKVVKLAVLRA